MWINNFDIYFLPKIEFKYNFCILSWYDIIKSIEYKNDVISFWNHYETYKSENENQNELRKPSKKYFIQLWDVLLYNLTKQKYNILLKDDRYEIFFNIFNKTNNTRDYIYNLKNKWQIEI